MTSANVSALPVCLVSIRSVLAASNRTIRRELAAASAEVKELTGDSLFMV